MFFQRRLLLRLKSVPCCDYDMDFTETSKGTEKVTVKIYVSFIFTTTPWPMPVHPSGVKTVM